jgi:hypothetical protein
MESARLLDLRDEGLAGSQVRGNGRPMPPFLRSWNQVKYAEIARRR